MTAYERVRKDTNKPFSFETCTTKRLQELIELTVPGKEVIPKNLYRGTGSVVLNASTSSIE